MQENDAETDILSSLNEAQRRAATSNAATVAILAGPGSGKTHTLTARVVWLIKCAGYEPANVIVATFTVKAAREMKARLGKTLGDRGLEKKVVVGTFHSVARRYLAAYGKRIGLGPKFGIADDADSRSIVQRIIKRLDANLEPSYVRAWISKRKAQGTLHVAANIPRRPPEHPALQDCFREYQAHLGRSNLLDYDDLLVRCVELLRNHPTCVSNVQAVLIDEYQDTNGIQYELMKLFAQAHQRITIVGDPDQSIYGWRSAEIRNLHRFLRDYPETNEVSLEENYRSSRLILHVSLNVIQQDRSRYQKVLLPVHTKGQKPVLRKLKSSAAEGDWIVSELKRVIMMHGGMLRYEDIAILLRSASLSRHVESSLGKAGIPYKMIGGHKFYERKEIKALLDYLRVVYQPDNNDAVARIINVPRRGIGEATIKSLLEEAEQAQISLWQLLWRHCRGGRQAKTRIRNNMEQKLNTGLLKIISKLHEKTREIKTSVLLINLIEQLISQLNFKQHLEDDFADDHEQRWANVREFINLASDFARTFGNSEEDDLPTMEDVTQERENDMLGRFLANVALASDVQKDGDDQEKKSLVTISTIHAAKGLEWPVVFVPAVYSGSIPHARAEDLNEERRLLYVAMTRAQALLYLSCPLYGSQMMGAKVELSPFVEPLAARDFLARGPTFDRAVIEDTSKILGRSAPTERVIFENLPNMFSPEDDMFPDDPSREEFDDDPLHSARVLKRRRVDHGFGLIATSETSTWQSENATITDRATGFTMNSLPGFTTAGAHQKTLVAAAAAAESTQKNGDHGQRGGSTRRSANQSSLLRFLKKEPSLNMSSEVPSMEDRLSSSSCSKAHALGHGKGAKAVSSGLEPSRAVIEPKLSHHKLPNLKIIARPFPSKPKLEPTAEDYPCFSSSPPPPTPDDSEQNGSDPKSCTNRPAVCFHTTTYMASKKNGGVRRPVGLGPPPAMDRLRKPFKPLTMSRPGAQQG